MSNKKILICLRTGDASGDGHEKSDETYILSNLSLVDLQQAYERGISNLGIDISLHCRKYEDNTFPKKDYENLIQAGYNDNGDNLWEDNDIYYMELKVFIKIWLFIARFGNKSFEYKFLECNNSLNIGGYGLY